MCSMENQPNLNYAVLAEDTPFHNYDAFNAKRSFDKAHGKRAFSDNETSDEEEVECAQVEAQEEEWVDKSVDLLPRDQFEGTKAQYICHFVRHMLRLWGEHPEQEGVKEKLAFGGDCCKINFKDVETTMNNLCEELLQNKIHTDMVAQIHSFVVNTVKRDYTKATQAYIEITIGKTKWHQDVCVGEARHNKGYNARKIHRKEGTDFAENLGQNAKDGRGIESYMLCLKRLQTKAQESRPAG